MMRVLALLLQELWRHLSIWHFYFIIFAVHNLVFIRTPNFWGEIRFSKFFNFPSFVSNLLIFYSNFSKLSTDVKLELIYAYKNFCRISFRNEEIWRNFGKNFQKKLNSTTSTLSTFFDFIFCLFSIFSTYVLWVLRCIFFLRTKWIWAILSY